MNDNQCPKCKAMVYEKIRLRHEKTGYIEYDCGTRFYPVDGFVQSKRCRIYELEAKVEALEADNAKMRLELDTRSR